MVSLKARFQAGAAALARAPLPRLGAMAILAVAVHGYHLGVDDSAIYIPAIKRVADPSLYPFGAEFFLSHARLSIFASLVGGSARLSHLPADLAIFLWHVASIFLLLVAAWRLLGCCFASAHARWSGVALLAAALSVPVAGTALVIMDPYLTARSLSTPAALFAVGCYLSRRPRSALGWLLATAALHPQMAVYGALFVGCLALVGRFGRLREASAPAFGALIGLPLFLDFARLDGPARACLLSRTYFFVLNWSWDEWVGVFAPLALLGWFAVAKPRNTLPAFRKLAIASIPFGLAFTAAALVMALPRLESYNRLQPMRSLHLVYTIFFLLLGGLIGEYALKTRVWRWAALFVPMAVGMTVMQVSAFPASDHVEWPGSGRGNSWMEAFLWIRHHTPKEAVFAVDPDYLARPGEDTHGFRAVAERSVLADSRKDSGVVSLFPQLADEWDRQVTAQRGLDGFQLPELRGLAARYPVTWILTVRPGPAGLECPYRNGELAVCRM
jgi:hypothetical protein